MRIKKTSQYIEGGASISNTYGTSQSNGYSQEFLNGTTIFEDTVNGGVNTDITLTDSISNYKYIEVLCRRGLRNDNAGYNIIKIPIEATSQNTTLSFSWRGSTYLEEYTAVYTLSGTSMNLSYFVTRKTTISNNTSTLDTTTNNVYVKRITGYKY